MRLRNSLFDCVKAVMVAAVMAAVIVAITAATASAQAATAAAAALTPSAEVVAANRRLVPDISRYEGRTIGSVEVVTEGVARRDSAVESELLSQLLIKANTEYSAVRVREALEALYTSNRIANARVEAFETSAGTAPNNNGRSPIRLRFVVRPQPRVSTVTVNLISPPGEDTPITEDELRARLNLLEPGARVLQQTLASNVETIQSYLRNRGFYGAVVEPSQQLDPSGTRTSITFRVVLGTQARVGRFNINIAGFNPTAAKLPSELRSGEVFTIARLDEETNRIRQAIIELGYLAPQLSSPEIQPDPAGKTVTINLSGTIGPQVSVDVTGLEVSDKGERELLPIRREGSLDQSVIEEGRRRLRNQLQEDGYFFADVTAVCSITNSGLSPGMSAPPTAVATAETCLTLNAAELGGRTVNVTYQVEQGRRFKLTDIRIEGTNKLAYEDVAGDLRTQQATVLGVVPYLGYGRGYTSQGLLAQDRQTIRNRLRNLGYRRAGVDVRQGVSVDGENLIITFVVDEGPLTRVTGVEMRGNQIYTSGRLLDESCATARLRGDPCLIIDGPYSRQLARIASDGILGLYARNGYINAAVDFDVVELPRRADGDEQMRVIYNITEGEKVFVNRVFINGNEHTKREAVRSAIPLQEGEVLRADTIAESERALFASGAFSQVAIRAEPAGETASGFKRSDVIVEVEERKARTLDYGFGYSTDFGPLGIFEIRNGNLFGRLRQGTARLRASQRQQLLRLEYLDQRFRRYGERQFAPLALSVQYQRNTNVTRFFRSTIDRGNFGIVQRLNDRGEPIDVNCPLAVCEPIGEPTINRLTFNAETQREFGTTVGPRGETVRRNTLYVRYNYEDVRLYKIDSLLIAPILQPDRNVRLSRFGTTFVRDTRNDPADAVRGEFLTLDYAVALRQLGGNISFNKLQSTYRRYYRLDRLRGTVLAGSVVLGLANVFNPQDRDGDDVISDVDRGLPISERFFSGGSSTLRGFGFEEAGPRVAVAGGDFRNRDGEPVTLQPFTVPIGGNALAIVNLEARVPVTETGDIQLVPFYDGGNVFRRVGDIFKRGGTDEPTATNAERNLQARWTNTLGLGLRIKTPFGRLAVDYGYLLNSPQFLAPEPSTGLISIKRSQIHFRFGQAF